jgi:hypothetical protein
MKARNLLVAVLLVSAVGQIHCYKRMNSGSMDPREWLMHNATHEQKRLIANLQKENAVSNLKGSTFCFVGHKTPEFKMFNSLPPHVQEYLQKKLPSICFEDKFCTKADMTIKVHAVNDRKPSSQDIANFLSDTYNFGGF